MLCWSVIGWPSRENEFSAWSPSTVKEAVGIGGDSRRGQRDQRTELRGRTLQRKLVEQTAVHVGVERRIVFQQIARFALYRDAFGRARYLQRDFEASGTAE